MSSYHAFLWDVTKDKTMRIITLEEALNQGSTASELRVLANCLDRIAKDGYEYTDTEAVDDNLTVIREPAYDYKACRENAAALRRLARDVQRSHANDERDWRVISVF